MRTIIIIILFTVGLIGGAAALLGWPTPELPEPEEEEQTIDVATVRKAAEVIVQVIEALSGDVA